MGTMVNLYKEEAKIVLEKKNIFGEKANIIGVMDISGSIKKYFNNGTVQQTFERVLGVGMNMDSNKSIEVYAFNNDVTYIGEANEGNIENFTNNVFLKKVKVNGGTSYAPAMKAIVDKVEGEEKGGFFKRLFGKKEDNGLDKELPTFVFFFTDGENSDVSATKAYIKEISDKPIFWQFVGIGDKKMPFLDELDTMTGRVVDNANFFRAEDIKNLSNSGLYNAILNEYPIWLKEVRRKGIVK
ncbi:VWA domain-containing protein [Bacillus sp. NEAU-Y102]